jgi:hypothetical protein
MASLVGVPVPASASPASSRACSASSGSIGIERKGSHYEDDWRGNAGVVVRHSGARNWGGPSALVRSGAKVVVGGPAADRSKCGAPKERAASERQSAESSRNKTMTDKPGSRPADEDLSLPRRHASIVVREELHFRPI